MPTLKFKNGRKESLVNAYEILYDPTTLAATNVAAALDELKSDADAAAPAISGLAILSSTTGVDMKTATDTALYTVPTGKTLILTGLIVRDPSASLADGTDYDFGDIGTTNWLSTENLSSLTDTSTYYISSPTGAGFAKFAAGVVISIDVNTGSTLAATATVDLIGYLV